MSRKTRLAMIAVSTSSCILAVRGHEDTLLATGRLPPWPTTHSGGVSTTSTSTPAPDSDGWLAHEPLSFQLAFWFGCIVLLSAMCGTVCYLCFSHGPFQPVRRHRRRSPRSSRECLIPTQTSQSTLPSLSVEPGTVSGAASAPTTSATEFQRWSACGSPQDRPPRVHTATLGTRGGTFRIWPSARETIRAEEFGHLVRLLQPFPDGPPSYDAVAGRASRYNIPWPHSQHPAAMGVPRSPPPPYSYQDHRH